MKLDIREKCHRLFEILALILIASYPCYSQNSNGSLIGKVTSGDSPVPFATILVLSADSTILRGGSSSQKGDFTITGLPPASRLLKISCVGFLPTTLNINISSGINRIPPIDLEKDHTMLSEVKITVNRPMISLKNGSILADVANTPLRSLGTIRDVLQQLPGIDSRNEKLAVFGKGTPLIYINNRRLFDLSELDRLQSKDIATVELITSPGAKYDAEGRAVLVIRTKKNPGDGVSFQLTNKTTLGEYWGNAEELSMSYSRGKVSAFGSASHRYQKNPTRQQATYTIFSDTLWKQLSNEYILSSYPAYQINTGADISISKSHSVGVQYQYVSVPLVYEMNNSSTVYATNQLFDEISLFSATDDEMRKHLLNGFYTADLGKNLSAYMSVDYLGSRSDRSQLTNEGSSSFDNRELNVGSRSRFNLIAAKGYITYTRENNEVIEFGGEINRIRGQGYLVEQSQLINSNFYRNEEDKKAGFLTYQKQWEKTSLRAGLRYEYAEEVSREESANTIKARRHYGRLFPNFDLSRSMGAINMNLSIATRIKRPSFAELNDNNVYVNRFILQKGNPSLVDQNIFEVNYALSFKKLTLTAGYSRTKDLISSDLVNASYSGAEFIWTYTNYDRYEEINSSILFSNKMNSFWTVRVNSTFTKPIFKTEFNGHAVSHNDPNFYIAIFNDMTIYDSFILSLNYLFSDDYDSFLSRERGYNTINTGLRTSFFQKKLTVNLQVQDIFNQIKEGHLVKSNNIDSEQLRKRQTRYGQLTVTYQINTPKKRFRGKNAAENDLKRL